jgi:hypothetical protein
MLTEPRRALQPKAELITAAKTPIICLMNFISKKMEIGKTKLT